jgi:hypothetical protein
MPQTPVTLVYFVIVRRSWSYLQEPEGPAHCPPGPRGVAYSSWAEKQSRCHCLEHCKQL